MPEARLAKMPFRKGAKKFPVKLTTLTDELDFEQDWKATGRSLLELVCQLIGLRETWYFGLQFEHPNGFNSWLQMDKKVRDQVGSDNTSPVRVMLLAKLYPENVAEELLQEITQHLFFLQVKQAILSMDIYCPPETSVLLASYAVQAQYGDYDENTYQPRMLTSAELLPQRVISQYQMTPEMWEERIKIWYADHRGMARDEAEMEYLKIAQDLDMYGVSYFSISNKKNTDLWLGVTALGLNIYEKDNKLIPKTSFAWSEIRNVSYDDKKFSIKPVDKSAANFVFLSKKVRMNKLILDLCIGNHDMFMRRRKPDTVDVQQMKTQAKEEKLRRQIERNKLSKEKQLREAAERDRSALEERLLQYQEEIRLANEALRRSEETAELLAEKSRVAEEEAMLLQQKASEAEQEVNRMRLNAMKTEEEKNLLERKTRDAEILTARLVEESERRAMEADKLKDELTRARKAEKQAKERLQTFLTRNTLVPTLYSEPSAQTTKLAQDLSALAMTSPVSPIGNTGVTSSSSSFELVCPDSDVEQLSLEIEKERVEYLEKSKHLQEALRSLRTEIEVLKVGEKNCSLDALHAEQIRLGEDKYSTLRKVKSGSTKARVAFYEDL
ncbi:merlin [Neocloeon triangulifer]|uniref:merlin n=1 Tax=Neocloeon triangulifer TaxID=2078957 RepID=UPI00286F527A|nr:merlin [Neocloeon triangulifer]